MGTPGLQAEAASDEPGLKPIAWWLRQNAHGATFTPPCSISDDRHPVAASLCNHMTAVSSDADFWPVFITSLTEDGTARSSDFILNVRQYFGGWTSAESRFQGTSKPSCNLLLLCPLCLDRAPFELMLGLSLEVTSVRRRNMVLKVALPVGIIASLTIYSILQVSAR